MNIFENFSFLNLPSLNNSLLSFQCPQGQINFFVYMQKKDIYDNPVCKELLYEGSQRRYIYWVKEVQR